VAIGVNLTWNFVFIGTLVFERGREWLPFEKVIV
jgi:hypothetical protein